MVRAAGLALMMCLLAVGLQAEPVLKGGVGLAGLAQRGLADVVPERRGGSLFAGQADGGMFARAVAPPAVTSAVLRGSGVQGLRLLISQAESRRDGYDAVQHGAKIKPGKRPTQMTLGEIYTWIKDTPGQPHAIGKYQFIPPTLRRVTAVAGVREGDRFTPALQDRLADVLLRDAGIVAFRAGTLSRHAFMNNLAKIWAGLPNSSGKSHYHGYAGNKAAMTWARFDAEMARIFPG